MSGDLVARLLFAIIVASSLKKGTPLQCYICTSLENSACASSLSDITMSTCSLDEDSNSSTTTVPEITSTTLAPTESTTYSDTEYPSTTTDSSTSSTFAVSTNESSSTTTLESEDSSLAEFETTSSSPITTTETEDTTETPVVLRIKTEVTTPSSSVTNGSSSSGFGLSKMALLSDNATELLESVITEPQVRVLRETDETFACYTLTVTIEGETVTERGCVSKSSSMCDSLQEENYPGHNLTTCTTCTEDGCNSSAINLSGILSAFLLLITLFLTR